MGLKYVRVGKEMPFGEYAEKMVCKDCTFPYFVQMTLDYVKEKDRVSDVTLELPNGELQFVKPFWDNPKVLFSTAPNEKQLKSFYEKIPKMMYSPPVGKAETRMKMIRIIPMDEGEDLVYSLRVSGEKKSWKGEEPLKLFVEMPKGISKWDMQADGYTFRTPDKLFALRKIERDYKIGKNVMDDAILNFGFESAGSLEPTPGQKVVQICLMPRNIKTDDLLELMKSLKEKSGVTKTRFDIFYGSELDSALSARYAREEDITVNGSVKGHSHNVGKYLDELLKLFDYELTNDSMVDVGFLKIRPTWETASRNWGKLKSKYLEKIISALPTPVIVVGTGIGGGLKFAWKETVGAYRDERKWQKYYDKEMGELEKQVTERVRTDFFRGMELPQNKDFSDSCMIRLTREGEEDLNRLIEEALEEARSQEVKRLAEDKKRGVYKWR